MRATSLLIALLLAGTANAELEVVTDVAAGIKLPNSSLVLMPECHTVAPFTVDGRPVRGRTSASCGGDQPAFVGWPVKVKFDCFPGLPALRCHGGWFHYSNIGDGGDDRETFMDVATFGLEFSWTQRKALRSERLTADALRELNDLRSMVQYARD